MGGPVKLMIRWFSGPVESFREFRAPRMYGDGFLLCLVLAIKYVHSLFVTEPQVV